MERQKEEERQQKEKYKEAENEILRIHNLQNTYKSIPNRDRTMAFQIMKLNPRKVVWDELKSELKKNYRASCRLLHPDKCPLEDAKAAFQIVEGRVWNQNL